MWALEAKSFTTWLIVVDGEEHGITIWNSGKVAAEPGFEPGLEDPKSPVLPLHNSAPQLSMPKVGFEPTRGSLPNSF
jgi:hypothetical protein